MPRTSVHPCSRVESVPRVASDGCSDLPRAVRLGAAFPGSSVVERAAVEKYLGSLAGKPASEKLGELSGTLKRESAKAIRSQARGDASGRFRDYAPGAY